MSDDKCPVCRNPYDHETSSLKEQATIRTGTMGTPAVDKRTHGLGTTSNIVCVRMNYKNHGLQFFVHNEDQL